jgi:hypothetical protein
MVGDSLKKISAIIIAVFILAVFSGCATTSQEVSQAKGSLPVTGISDGLPREGLWRTNIVLYDMNGDGFLDIVAPPPRKGKEGQSRPFVFLWSAEEKKWAEGKYRFPDKPYSYGGVAVGDVNGDGYPDIVLAQHGKGLVLLLNDKANGFAESPLTVKDDFRSRAVVLPDVNGDGRPDIIALSEASFAEDYKPKGILVGVNKGGEWDFRTIEGSAGLFGDALATGDLRGSGNRDIAAALLTASKEQQKLIWLGDGKGGFAGYTGELFGDGLMTVAVRIGDVDGDGKGEAVFSVAEVGPGASKEKGKLAILKWTGEGFKDISSGPDLDYIFTLDLVDIDGDGKAEIVALTKTGIHIYKYDGTAWAEKGRYPLPEADILNVTDLRAGRNKDGSVLIAIGSGNYESRDLGQGIRAYLLK